MINLACIWAKKAKKCKNEESSGKQGKNGKGWGKKLHQGIKVK